MHRSASGEAPRLSTWLEGIVTPTVYQQWAVGRATDATGSYPVPAGFDSPAAYQDRFILFLFTYIGLAKPIFRSSVEAAR